MNVRSCGSPSSGALKPLAFADDRPVANAEVTAGPPATIAASPAECFTKDRRLIMLHFLPDRSRGVERAGVAEMEREAVQSATPTSV